MRRGWNALQMQSTFKTYRRDGRLFFLPPSTRRLTAINRRSMMLKRSRSAAIGLCVLLAAGGIAWAAGNYSTYPVVGGSSFCISTVSGAGGFNAQGHVRGAGATGQGH